MDEGTFGFAVTGAAFSLITLYGGYWYGRRQGKRNLHRAVLRTRGKDSQELSIQPHEDGAMELVMSGKALKDVKNGKALVANLNGRKGSMVFRVRRL